jgi:hypothetical protein
MTNLLKTIITWIFIMATTMSFQKIKAFNCEAYKKGKFSKFIYNNTGLGHWTRQEIFIVRDDSMQTEIVQMSPTDTIFYQIKWTGDCKYKLHFIKATNTLADSIIRYYSKPRDLKYVIQQGNDKYYIEKKRDKIDTTWVRQ